MSRGELERQEPARGDTFRLAWDGGGLVGEVGQDRLGGACTGLWLPSESLPWELGGVGGICSDSRPETRRLLTDEGRKIYASYQRSLLIIKLKLLNQLFEVTMRYLNKQPAGVIRSLTCNSKRKRKRKRGNNSDLWVKD